MLETDFGQSFAVIIGINQYQKSICSLETPVSDAKELAHILECEHGYNVMLLLDEEASLASFTNLLEERLPQTIRADDRLLFYFAGHGKALKGEDGPAGYLIPQNALPEDRSSFLPLQFLHDSLTSLPCRHALIVLDCCFGGALRWASLRDLGPFPEILHQERYQHYIQDPAWQVITSAAYDQQALDTFNGFNVNSRGRIGNHSPFAQALFDGLKGAADILPAAQGKQPAGDGVITATELYLYLRDRIEPITADQRQRQTPGLWPLRKHDKGEFIFLVPGKTPNLPPAPELNRENNPYRALEPFEEEHQSLFFGRERWVEQLKDRLVANKQPLMVVLGASGSGKSSLIKAGLLPQLRHSVTPRWQILGPFRPGTIPCQVLAQHIKESLQIQPPTPLPAVSGNSPQQPWKKVLEEWLESHPGVRILLIIDQFEELITQCQSETEREQFLRVLKSWLDWGRDRVQILITLRSDFEPQFANTVLASYWTKGARFVVEPMTQNELRRAIEGPAAAKVLYFEPSSLVDRLINEVSGVSGALPLLSFTLSELYLRYLERHGNDRALVEADYDALGGVANSLTRRASEEFEHLINQEPAYAETIRRIMLRMVSLTGDGLTRRRLPGVELDYQSPEENKRVQTVIQHFTDARLLVQGLDSDGHRYVEPAHDVLVSGWPQIQTWVSSQRQRLLLQQQITRDAVRWRDADQRLDTLLSGESLKEAERYLSEQAADLNRLEQLYIQASQRKRRRNRLTVSSSVAASLAVVLGGVGFGWWQQQQSSLDQLIRDTSAGIQTPELVANVAKRLPGRLITAEQSARTGEVDKAMADYQEILTATNKLLRGMGNAPQTFPELERNQPIVEEARDTSEAALAELIKQHRLPQLEAELKAGNYGELVNPDFNAFEDQYTGALRTTYAVLMREFGAKADLNNDGYLNDFEEEEIPCDTLREIEEMWRQITENRCGWYGVNDYHEAPDCRELNGRSLVITVTTPASIYLMEKRITEQCQISPLPPAKS